MQIRLHDVDGQTLRVGIRRGDKARPPLLLFNGIGAISNYSNRFSTLSTGRPRSSLTCQASAVRRRHGCHIAYRHWQA